MEKRWREIYSKDGTAGIVRRGKCERWLGNRIYENSRAHPCLDLLNAHLRKLVREDLHTVI